MIKQNVYVIVVQYFMLNKIKLRFSMWNKNILLDIVNKVVNKKSLYFKEIIFIE